MFQRVISKEAQRQKPGDEFLVTACVCVSCVCLPRLEAGRPAVGDVGGEERSVAHDGRDGQLRGHSEPGNG